MYAGFNLKIDKQEDMSFLHSQTSRDAIIDDYKMKYLYCYQKIAKESLEFYLQDNGTLDAEQIERDWFPGIKADIFLSHSHQDEKLVLDFAAWLYNSLGLVAFVDSCVWGFADELLKDIDNKYCVHDYNPSLYSYNKRNHSTSYVHMLLNTALAKMIDSTECLILVNTPASLNPKNAIYKSTTHSPWIYSELWLSKIIRRQKQHRAPLKKARKILLSEGQELPLMDFPVPIRHLCPLDSDDLKNWEKECVLSNIKGPKALDVLYEKKQQNIF